MLCVIRKVRVGEKCDVNKSRFRKVEMADRARLSLVSCEFDMDCL